MEIEKLEGAYRHDVIKLLPKKTGNIGVELGVARGIFSQRMVESGYFENFFGIDVYGDTHDTEEYKEALNRVGLFNNYKLLRMSFDEAYDLFDDESLDFVYIDGYAHTGEEGGDTIFKWANKVKNGGVIAGDDYSTRWPLVVEAVNEFIKQTGFDLKVTTIIEPHVSYSSHPSWVTIKTHSTSHLHAPEEMKRHGKREGAKKLKRRMRRVARQEAFQKFITLFKGQ